MNWQTDWIHLYLLVQATLTKEHVEQEEQLLLAEVGDGHFVFFLGPL